MKSKFLFAAMLGGVALASCNVKDGLDPEISPSNQSPAFIVSLEDDFAATRADMGLTTGKLSFVAGDKMTLYHGGANDFSGAYENAVYEGYVGTEENAMKFTTRAMVKEGYAVMVYPADLAFTNKADAPEISIKLNGQTKEDADNTPFVSEILQIKEYGSDPLNVNTTAGYGRDYDLILKRLASTLLLTLDEDGELDLPAGVAPLKVIGVEVKNEDPFFTKSVTVKPGAKIGSDEFKKAHSIWSNQTDITVGDTKEKSIKTKYVVDDVAVFTMLPFGNSLTADAEIIVYTNYGSVTVKGDAEKVWSGDALADNTKGQINVGLGILADKLWGAVTESSKLYDKGVSSQTKAGKGAKRTLKVDYSTIDMNNTHIQTSEQLVDVLKVYDHLIGDEATKTTNFFLDGDKNGRFYMNEAALKAYAAHIGKNSNVTFTPCRESGEKCTTIVLTADAATVPTALDFKTDVIVVFDGAWTLAGEHAFKGVSEFKVPAGSTLTLNGTIQKAQAKAILDNYVSNDVVNGISVDGKVVVTTGQTVTLKDFNMDNHGTIEIPAGSALLINSVELTNNFDEYTGLEIGRKTGYQLLKSEGQINVHGRLAVTDAGKINNYGVITMKSEDAYVYVTTNGISSSSYGAPYNKDSNKFGSIVLFDASGNENTVIAGKKGFLKLVIDDKVAGSSNYTVTDKMIGSVANYVVLNGSCVAYDALTVGEDETVVNKVTYLEINSSKQVKVVGDYRNDNSFAGIWVREGSNVNIPTGSAVKTSNLYLQGYIYDAGISWNKPSCVTYFGDSTDSYKDHYAYTGSTK